jgi:hypothetical protein
MSQLRKAFAGLNQIDFTGLRFRLIDASGQVCAGNQPTAGHSRFKPVARMRGARSMSCSTTLG